MKQSLLIKLGPCGSYFEIKGNRATDPPRDEFDLTKRPCKRLSIDCVFVIIKLLVMLVASSRLGMTLPCRTPNPDSDVGFLFTRLGSGKLSLGLVGVK